ncbi:MAG: 4-(cytidine 5'-diphospho)-2-C-methyl-D-erythritol kinase [Veillonellaceae bacterium]|nr:4-(cytidine 5'-diphospho)-2-C-methyl-D-erythritol kinase [Veillonellaceae bacterium]MDD6563282.1 4-(cytidine 5'-diphospho)-2-C-methyl-D-erythritol kinase [Veillonellaceae bacterium]MDY5052672.1 4-(cytidine 5'-diphospho)-2-C-methyl-D-erythritol kinase [Anaerovibrio sp.]MEE0457898.1 4-(cytidine 5'-diphospho)-2-C-methyl-D-erythritol kinase [Anaerovibrio sp.]
MLTLSANAKINLTLDILGTREDGYHEVAMIMQEISLHDTLSMGKINQGISLTIVIEGQQGTLPADESNLCWKAAALVQKEYNLQEGVEIHLTKRIPMAAGLAGGSADAAAVLKGMNHLFRLGMTEARLCELGARLGSDIPFCIMGGTMLATGRGEILTRLPSFPRLSVVLAKPPVGVSTAWAYKTYDAGYDGPHPDNEAMLEAIHGGDAHKAAGLLCNVLEGVTETEHPVIADYKRLMMEHGAMASMMSGSGPTVFGLVREKQQAWHLADTLKKYDGEAGVFVAETLG